jgi:molybdate transport system permease protein
LERRAHRDGGNVLSLLVRSVRTSFADVNVRLEQIAATLGASPLKIFFVVTMPLAYRGIVAGALLRSTSA